MAKMAKKLRFFTKLERPYSDISIYILFYFVWAEMDIQCRDKPDFPYALSTTALCTHRKCWFFKLFSSTH